MTIKAVTTIVKRRMSFSTLHVVFKRRTSILQDMPISLASIDLAKDAALEDRAGNELRG
jgi:hypothetical protein